MTIGTLIKKAFPEGLEYDDAAQLCLTLYSAAILPDEFMIQCTKENLSDTFAELTISGVIHILPNNTAPLYGANSHDPKDRGHWIEIIASIFKIGGTVDMGRRENLKNRLNNIGIVE